MNLVLDTHFLIWVLTDSPRLKPKARELIADAEGVYFSEASIWELGLKFRKGKIAVEPRRILAQALHDGLRPIGISMEAMLLSCELSQDHADPFDRLLYAQTKLAGHRLLTEDNALAKLGQTAMTVQ